VLLLTVASCVSGQSCSEHRECGRGNFCDATGRCEVLTECHDGHDAIDGLCPGPSNAGEGQPWARLRQYDEARGDSGHEYLWQGPWNRSNKIQLSALLDHLDVPEWHSRYYDKDGDAALDYSEFIPFARERFAVYLLTEEDLYSGEDPEGHLQPLGMHRQSDGEIDIIREPIHPRDFWRKYVEQHRPCLFKGVDINSTGAKLWSPEYITKTFGHIDLKIEPKKEARGDSLVLNAMPKRLSIDEFMKRRKADNIYAVSILPQEMAWDVNVPSSLLCGGRRHSVDKRSKQKTDHTYPHPSGHSWLTHMLEANLWLADGRTRSQVHYDKENNVNCLYRGRKRWILIDTREHYNDMQWVRGGRYIKGDDLLNMGTDWVPIDPDSVDMRVHKDFAKVRYQEVIQEPGDCIFLPYSMLHWVNKTNPDFQVAASYMWLPTEIYDEESCKDAPLHKVVPLAAFDILWYYSGRGVIPQGYLDPGAEMIPDLQRLTKDMGQQYFTLRVLQQWLNMGSSPLKDNLEDQKRFHQRLSSFAKNPERGLHISELGMPTVPVEEWLKLAAEGDPEGMLPCDIGHAYEPRPQSELKKMDEVLVGLVAEYKAQTANKKEL